MESFELNGKWWCPEKGGPPVPGTLKFDPAVAGWLIIQGGFQQMTSGVERNEDGRFPVVLGTADDDSPITLLAAKPVLGQSLPEGFYSETLVSAIVLIPTAILKGHHFLNVDEIEFEEVSLGYTLLDSWISKQPFSAYNAEILKWSRDNPDGGKLTLAYDPEFKSFAIQVDEGKIKFWEDPSPKHDDRPDSNTNCKRISIFLKEKQFAEYQKFVNIHLRNFLTLATGSPNYPTNVKGFLSNGRTRSEINIYYWTQGYTNQPRMISRMLFTFGDLNCNATARDFKENLQRYLNNWIAENKLVESVHEVFFRSQYLRMDLDTLAHFLIMSQALEAYHREIYATSYIPKDRYETIACKLKGVIRHYISNKYISSDSQKAKLNYMIDSGNEYTLANRINSLRKETLKDYFSDILKVFTPVTDKKFARHVAQTRNYYAHLLKDRKDVIPDDELSYYVEKLDFMLRVLFLINMGFSSDKIAELLKPFVNTFVGKI